MVEIIAHNFAHNKRAASPGVVLKYPKTDARYWRSRVFRNVRNVRGAKIEDEHFSIQLMHGGRRERFNTNEREKAAAAAVAAEIYREIDRAGWDAALERFKPAKVQKNVPLLEAKANDNPTVGDYLAFVSIEGGLQPSTFGAYSRMFRLIVSSIAKVKKTKRRFYAGGKAVVAWRAQVDAMPLADVNAEAVRAWKRAYLKEAGTEPTTQARAQVTANSILRQAKALFSKRLVDRAKEKMRLPEPLPLTGVDFSKVPSSYYRYRSKMDVAAIMQEAQEELASGDRFAEFQILVLALCCGLRRNEIDKLLWEQVHFDTGAVSIETTRYFKAKSDASNAEVDLEPELVALLRGWKLRAKSEFVIECDIAPRLGGNSPHYRLSCPFASLILWLRSKGIDAPKPLHTLRKEYGSLVLKHHGIYAASVALRHEDLQVTVKHYADSKQRATPGLGALLVPSNVRAVKFDSFETVKRIKTSARKTRTAKAGNL